MAKKFKFKLQPVLRYRERIEEDTRNRFLQAAHIRDAKEADIRQLRSERAGAVDSMTQAKQGVIDVDRLRLLNRYITGLEVSETQRQGELKVIEVEVEKRRLELVAAKRQVMVLEKLRDKRKAEHQYEEDREEGKVFDELGLQRTIERATRAAKAASVAGSASNSETTEGETP